MIRRSLFSSMRWSTTMTVNMPMLANNLSMIEERVGNTPANIKKKVTKKNPNVNAAATSSPSATPSAAAANATPTLVLPMVKGNAYGCGILPISHFVSTHLGYKTLGVASLGEALFALERLPDVASDATQTFVIFSDTEISNPKFQKYYSHHLQQQGQISSTSTSSSSSAQSLKKLRAEQSEDQFVGSSIVSPLTKVPIKAKLIPVIGTKEDLHYFLDSIESKGAESPFFNTPLFVKVDSGMNRMGLSPREVVEASPRIRRLRPSIQSDEDPLLLSSASNSSDKGIADHILRNQRTGIDLLLTHFASSWFPLGKEAHDRAFLDWSRDYEKNSFPILTRTFNSGGKGHTVGASTASTTSCLGTGAATATTVNQHQPSSSTIAPPLIAPFQLPPPLPLNRTLQQYHTFKTLEIFLKSTCGIAIHNVSVSNSGAIEQQIGTGFNKNSSSNHDNNSASVSSSSSSPSSIVRPSNVVVRPGLMMYGPPSVTTPKKLWHGQTIARLEAKVVKTFVVGDAADVGFGGGGGECITTVPLSTLVSTVSPCSSSSSPLTSTDDKDFLDSLPPLPFPIANPRLTSSTGSCVGYAFNATRGGPTVVAVIAMGYADGFLRYNAGLKLSINGLEGEVHGFVNMDLAQIVFYPNELDMTVEEVRERLHNGSGGFGGDRHSSSSSPIAPVATIWGHENSDIDSKATFLKTNPYQLLTALSVRVPRVYEYGDTFEKPSPDVIEALKWDTCRFV